MNERDIWKCDESRSNLWEEDAARAARLAYLEVMMMWGEQVEAGQFGGVPAFHRSESPADEPHTQRSRPPQYTPDSRAGAWEVPQQLRERYKAAA